VCVIGVDWSTEESKRGVAVIHYSDEAIKILDLAACNSRRTALALISKTINEGQVPSLIAIDAPLGWPVGLRRGLMNHAAGIGLDVSPDEMFSRDTDRIVHQTLKKRPLEVGANLIARTAHSANQFLHDLRKHTSRQIPLLWQPDELRDVGVIEVYPAATKIVTSPHSAAMALGVTVVKSVRVNEHVEDALWCALAAVHFVRGECRLPDDPEKSRREGWIWVRDREISSRSPSPTP